MNILASYRYQLADHKKAILIFYLVIVLLICVTSVSATIAFQHTNVQGTISSGGELATLIFLFVIGLCSFKETFLFSVQNGISRKTIFAAKLLTMVSVAAIMSVVDTALFVVLKGIQAATHSSIRIDRTYTLFFDAQQDGIVVLQIKSTLLEMLMALAVMAIGYFITILFYRLNKAGKIAVAVGVPVLLTLGLPSLDYVTNGAVTRFSTLLSHAFNAFSTPPRMCVSCFVIFAAASGLSFLLMRRAVVRAR